MNVKDLALNLPDTTADAHDVFIDFDFNRNVRDFYDPYKEMIRYETLE